MTHSLRFYTESHINERRGTVDLTVDARSSLVSESGARALALCGALAGWEVLVEPHYHCTHPNGFVWELRLGNGDRLRMSWIRNSLAGVIRNARSIIRERGNNA